VSTCAAHGCAL